MELLFWLVTAAGSSLVRSLASGAGHRGGVAELAGDATKELLGNILRQQDEVIERLDRIEKKVDQLSVQPSKTAYMVGVRHLRTAANANGADRPEFLLSAIENFTVASESSRDVTLSVDADALAALCFLMRGQAPECHRVLDAASRRLLEAINHARDEFAKPTVESYWQVPAQRFFGLALAFRRSTTLRRRTGDTRRFVLEHRFALSQRYDALQDLRVACGESPERCSHIRGFWTPGEGDLDELLDDQVLEDERDLPNWLVLTPRSDSDGRVDLGYAAVGFSWTRTRQVETRWRTAHVIDSEVALTVLDPIGIRIECSARLPDWSPLLGTRRGSVFEDIPDLEQAAAGIPHAAGLPPGQAYWNGARSALPPGSYRIPTRSLAFSPHGLVIASAPDREEDSAAPDRGGKRMYNHPAVLFPLEAQTSQSRS